MVIVKIISATGRLKNKIDFSYNVSVNAGEVIADSGIIYNPNPLMVTSGSVSTISYFGAGTFSTTLTNIPNGKYYAVAYAGNSGSNIYSAVSELVVSDSGYEVSSEGLTIANPISITNGTEGVNKVLVSDSSGLVTWKPIKSLFNYGHYIGELYGGGIVVDLWKEGDDEKVLIASLENLNSTLGFYNVNGSSYSTTWIYGGTSSTTLIGASAQSLYNGRQNTDSILFFSTSKGYTGSVAQVCVDYRGGGYDDWYLPSYYEINSLYNNANIVNRVLQKESVSFYRSNLSGYSQNPTYYHKGGYWTSTEASSTEAYSMDNYLHAPRKLRLYPEGELPPKIRAMRKESLYAGSGLCLALDSTNVKSFSDTDYLSIGTASRWVDLVNAGMTSSYSFNLSANPTTSSGGTPVQIFATVSSINGPGVTYSGNSYRDPLGGFVYDNWYLSNITNSVVAVPRLYNNGGTSSFISTYFLVSYKDTTLKFQTADVSSIVNMVGATLNIYVSTKIDGYSSNYKLIRQITNTGTSNSNISIPLYSYHGKTISIKITAPNASYTSVSSYTGPTLDEISLVGTNGGYQATGPVYFPDESGFLRFSGSSIADPFSEFGEVITTGSYIDFSAPIGNTTTVTVELCARIRYDNFLQRVNLIFGWDRYDVLIGQSGSFGFNTGQGDIYGITSSRIQEFNNVWKHYVFEMRSDVSYTNNKIYINGEQQELGAQNAPYNGGTLGVENPTYRNFNSGIGRIGGWRNSIDQLFDGDISVFRVYNRALTKDEIMKNYNIERKRYEILPSVMKNKIKMSFDANLSYSGTGTVITELSGSHSNGSIVTSSGYISPTYSISNTLYPGKYFTFNGFNTKIEYAPILLTENMSWEAWIRCTGTVSSPNFILNGSVNMFMGQVLPYFGFEKNKILFSNYINSTQTYLRSTSNLLLNKWYHVVGTTETVSNKTLSKIYINGVKSVESYNNGTQSKYESGFEGTVDYNFAIGDGQGTDRQLSFEYEYPTQWYPFKGDVGQVRVYYKTLSYEEVKNNYSSSKHIYENDFNDSNNFYSHELNGNPTFSIYQNMVLDIPGKANENILKSDSNGKSSWVDKNYLFTKPNNYRYIGEFYGGGIIVAMWKYPSNVFNYLIMSSEDINSSATYSWSNITATASNATSEHNGSSNTNTIITQPGHSTSASKICDDYTGGGFTNWYLPSVTELNQGFNAAQIVDSVLGTDKLTGSYWTSTEIDTNTAYSYDFNNTTDKRSSINVSSKVLTPAGTIDTSFVYGTGFDFLVQVITIQSNGKILVGGNFASYNGTTANSIIRLNTDGSVDTSFVYGTGFNGAVRSIVVQSDNKILVGGEFTNYNGTSANRIIRLNTDGTIDPSFVYGTGFNQQVYSIAIQSDGKILVGGFFTNYKGVSSARIIRVNTDGSKDTSFVIGSGFSYIVNAITIQSDGKILVGGEFTSYNGTPANYIIRLNSNGSIDTSFVYGTGFSFNVYEITIQSDGKILVGGQFTSYNGTPANNIVRLNSNGSIDTSFVYGTGFNSIVLSISIQVDGKILVGGFFTNYDGTLANNIIRLNSDGSIDSSFVTGVGIQNNVYSIAIQNNVKILVGGLFSSYNDTPANNIVSLNSIDIPNRFKIRPFRLAQVYDNIHHWQDNWEPEYTPIWGSPYTWDEGNWSFVTSITIDINPIKQNINLTYPGIFSFTFSNTVTTNETVINTGVCWATSSTTPTIANSFTYSQSGGPTIFNTKTPNITGPGAGTYGQTNYIPNILFFRAFVTTPSGVYYSSNGNHPNGGTYLAAGSINKTFPTDSYVPSLQTLYAPY